MNKFVPEGVDPAFNWHVGKTSRGGMGEQVLEEARNQYTKVTTGQTVQGMFDQVLSVISGPVLGYKEPIPITRKQKYGRLNLDEAIKRELGYLQGETNRTASSRLKWE